jgi:hypothetical protein
MRHAIIGTVIGAAAMNAFAFAAQTTAAWMTSGPSPSASPSRRSSMC